MIILGIDPGTATTGFGVIEHSGNRIRHIENGIIKTLPKDSQSDRLLIIKKAFVKLINKHKPDQLAIEKLFFSKNASSARYVYQALGVILMCAADKKIPITEYAPNEVKSAITGFGKADKKQMQEMVKTLLNLKEIPKPDDAADGLAIAICHSQKSGVISKLKAQIHSPVTITTNNTEAFVKVSLR